MTFAWSAAALVGWLGVVRLLAPVSPTDEPWSTRVDVPLALVSGLAFAWLTAVRMPPYHLAGWPLTGSDFFQYCESVGAVVRGERRAFWDQRSWVAAQLPGALAARYGVLGGLALAAAASQVVLGAALYLWGRAAHSRFAGIATVLLGTAVAPLVVLARTVSFYPESVAACALCAASGAVAVRWRTVPAFVFAGAGAGLALLVDVRGLYWALATLGIAAVAAVATAPARVPLRLLALSGPVVLSWWMARAVGDSDAPGLTRQTSSFVRDVRDRLQLPSAPEPVDEPVATDFLWGRTRPLEVPGALAAVGRLAGELPEAAATHPEVVAARATHVDAWHWPALGAGLLAVFGLVRRPWQLLALLGPLVPYAVSLRTTALVLTHPRYLAVAFAGLPVLLGVAAAVAGTREGRGLPPGARLPVTVALVAGLVLGIVPSWLSPVAPWRIPQTAEQFPRELELGRRVPNGTDHVCAALLADDAASGRTWAGYPPPP